MKPRPAFPAKIDLASGKPKAANPTKTVKVNVPPVQGLGLDSQAVRLRMVQRLQQEGIEDEMVLKAMAETGVITEAQRRSADEHRQESDRP